MKLTDIHIKELYKFTRKHYVEHYDVQTELVDHLANDIEEICNEKPSLSFKEARDLSFKKFGVFGFMEVVEQKQKAMNKRYWKILWRFFKEWFTVPKLLITATIYMIFCVLLQIKYSEYILLGCVFILAIVDLILISINHKKRKEKERKKENIFLLESMIGTTRHSYASLILVNLFNLINLSDINFSSLAIHWIFVSAFIATLLCILFYVVNYVIPQKAEELLQETYPEYKIVKNL
ncbi:hypothetical protein H9W90_11625 [Polaribacter pectinis]|uniref:Uncharacterized protein n=1 Tax=Polaribacter pectinis TaxID=2738844 RepID=A0A7G9L889_9FLAO|nr:hypothetical protein [Polaribacter pectinis]QNM84838.1 hypothetical protein H9W90_11625 [Polaribacter pectinis]